MSKAKEASFEVVVEEEEEEEGEEEEEDDVDDDLDKRVSVDVFLVFFGVWGFVIEGGEFLSLKDASP